MADDVDREEISIALLGSQARERLRFMLRDRDVHVDDDRLVVSFAPALRWAVQSAYDEAAAGDVVGRGLTSRFGPSERSATSHEDPATVGPIVAPASRRVGAGAVDYLLISILTLVLALGLGSGWLAYLVAEFAIVVAPMALTGRPPGARAMGTIVVTSDDGSVPSWSASIVRWVVAHLPLLAVVLTAELGGVEAWPVLASIQYGGLALVYAGVVVHRLGQGLHDRAAGTYVIMR